MMITHTLHRILRIFSNKQSILYFPNSPCEIKYQFQYRTTLKWFNFNHRNYSKDFIDLDESVRGKKKKVYIPRITLLSEKNEISVVTLEEAQKIANRRDFKLVKVIDLDTKSEREVYKLMTMYEYLQEQTKNKVEARQLKNTNFKHEKLISISSMISNHDLNTKISNIHRILKKKNLVRVAIAIDEKDDKAKQVADCIAERSKDIAKVTITSSRLNLIVNLQPIIDKINEQSVDNPNSSIDSNT